MSRPWQSLPDRFRPAAAPDPLRPARAAANMAHVRGTLARRQPRFAAVLERCARDVERAVREARDRDRPVREVRRGRSR